MANAIQIADINQHSIIATIAQFLESQAVSKSTKQRQLSALRKLCE